MTLGNMLPTLAGHYSTDLRLRYIKALRDLPLGQLALKLPNFRDLNISEFRGAVLGAFCRGAKARLIGVQRILLRCAPFQIFNTVVRLVTVLVVDLMVRGRRWLQECGGNQSMDGALLLLAVKADGGTKVAATNEAQTKNALWDNLGGWTAPPARPADDCSLNRSDPPNVRNFVAVLEADDWPPNLFHSQPHAFDTLWCNNINTMIQMCNQGELQ